MNALLAPTPAAPGDDLARCLERYCAQLGDDPSTTASAIAWARRAPGHLLDQLRAGRRRADQLRDRLRRNAAGTEIPA